MKKIISCGLGLISITSFCFYRFKENDIYSISNDAITDSEHINKTREDYPIIRFIHDKSRGYTIAHISFDVEKLEKSNQFLECNPKANFVNPSLYFTFYKERTGILLDCIFSNIQSSNLISLVQNNIFHYDVLPNSKEKIQELSQCQTIFITDKIIVSKEIQILNEENHVSLFIKGNRFNFQKVLTNYIKATIKHNKAIKKIKPYTYDYGENRKKSKAAYEIRLAKKNINLGKEKFQFLALNEILAIYHVFEDNLGNKSILWGLGKNKNTKEIFHWITDLENDISDLIAYKE